MNEGSVSYEMTGFNDNLETGKMHKKEVKWF